CLPGFELLRDVRHWRICAYRTGNLGGLHMIGTGNQVAEAATAAGRVSRTENGSTATSESSAGVSRMGYPTRAYTQVKTIPPGEARRAAGRGFARLRSRRAPNVPLAATGPATGRIER